VALLEFNGVAFGYSDERVIVEATGALHEGNVIGLVGANGGGKTTLLKVLLSELLPEQGRVQRARAARVAYVAQSAAGDDAQPLYSFVREGREDLAALERELAALTEQVSAHSSDALAMARLGEAESQFSALGGHAWDTETARLLQGLSFIAEDFDKALAQLSGGQRQKACLARALLSGSNCLIFDEPTNHLDLQAQAFFANYIKTRIAQPRAQESGPIGVILVSHDRWLLDALATHVWELEDGVLYRYAGNYSQYVPARELRRKQALDAFQRQQDYVARTEEYIRRNIAGQNTRQARGRRTILGRMQRMDRPSADPEMRFVLSPQLRTGEQVLIVEDLAFAYGATPGTGGAGSGSAGFSPRSSRDAAGQAQELVTDPPDRGLKPALPASSKEVYIPAGPQGLALNPLLPREHGAAVGGEQMILRGVGFGIYRGERLGIAGSNGCGKTTLLKLLARQLPPLSGMVAWGSNAELGVFSQDSADLTTGRDLLAELRDVEPGISDSQGRDYLARFGFSGDDVLADVGSLSGGERSRLSLAKIFRRRPNVLLFDEPTNHLDIYAREALEQFLEAYEGTMILVTHDRALLERLCNRLLIFERGADGAAEVRFFRGHYHDYLAWRENSAGALRREAAAGEPGPGASSGAPGVVQCDPALMTPEDVQALARQGRTSVEAYINRQLDRAKRKAGEIEAQIAALEQQALELAAAQREADARGEYGAVMRLQEQLDALNGDTSSLFDELHDAETASEAWAGLRERCV
jgi:ATP-binding cassette, subfamily F, member 3